MDEKQTALLFVRSGAKWQTLSQPFATKRNATIWTLKKWMYWRVGWVVESAGFENRLGAIPHRFKSCTLRKNSKLRFGAIVASALRAERLKFSNIFQAFLKSKFKFCSAIRKFEPIFFRKFRPCSGFSCKAIISACFTVFTLNYETPHPYLSTPAQNNLKFSWVKNKSLIFLRNNFSTQVHTREVNKYN